MSSSDSGPSLAIAQQISGAAATQPMPSQDSMYMARNAPIGRTEPEIIIPPENNNMDDLIASNQSAVVAATGIQQSIDRSLMQNNTSPRDYDPFSTAGVVLNSRG